MRCLAKNKAFLLLPLLLWLLSTSTYASPFYASSFAATVTKAEIYLKENNYVLSAEIKYHLSDEVKEALQNGVPLFWTLLIKLKQHRDFIWDYTLVEKTIRYRIEYHALLNMYRIKNENTSDSHNFSTLSAALDLMSSLRDFTLIGKDQISPLHQYNVEIKIDFDRNALPLPLRPIASINPQWYLSSDWTVWPLKK